MIIQVKTKEVVMDPDFFGPDAGEYCEKYNLFHKVSDKGELWFVDTDEETAESIGIVSIVDKEIVDVFPDSKGNMAKAIFSIRCYKNYEDIVRDRRRVDTDWRRRGNNIMSNKLEFVKFMAPRKITVDGIPITI